ncbi:response regulator transcription factor [Paenibacillus alvei]|uniref:Response regulator transcription factor n=2 Tax=Paenibacillus TaxID=44249 RepID=A0AAP6ZYN4_PAEAL|nr:MULTISPECIES: response regulator transcription factor [Paenibacillus]EJW19562.1 response regulator [Paenibacillus alvei DSM 29]MBG9735911.1 transcriptional regulator [Paenibacillus alvei]MBG9742506.1 transcriptional regulator [Paenibacillus alvei]MCY7485613.1 response regulator transcription factor [Paenibacillus alvei]MCY9541381.1 response regulator transcription factor [Paenibacillus alvei]
MNQTRLLIIDDEDDMRALVQMYLKNSGFEVHQAANGEEALEVLSAMPIDLIVADVMMPVLDGFTLCLNIRQSSNVPIVFLTARGEEWDRVYGLKIGADDYIVKPFSPSELIARIDAVLRRVHRESAEDKTVQQYGQIEINERGRTVKVCGEPLSLTLKEFELLLFLCRHRGQALSREQLLEHVWGIDYEGSVRTVDTHIKTLRIKLGNVGEFIQTMWGIGYKLEV